MNTDQGSQFTSFAWTERLKRMGTGISMDGKGRCLDHIFIERLGRKADLHYPFTASQIEALADIHNPDLQIFVAVMAVSA
jgi:transposase InsO family protein